MKRSRLVLWSVLLLAASNARADGIWEKLSAEQKAAISRGEQVMVTEDMPGKPWPKVTLYQRVATTPEEAAAVFFDYERAVEYVPGLKKSRISRRIDARTFEIDYTLGIPVLADENYTTRNRLSAYAAGGSAFSIDWTLTRADSTRFSEGFARFETLGTGCLFAYYNYVVPSGGLADKFRKRAIRQVSEAAQAVRKQAEQEKSRAPALLTRQVEALQRALGKR
jgi:hypothetical protein